MTSTANDFLLGSGVPSAKFNAVNDMVKGAVVSFRVEQQRDFDTGEPKFWNDDETQPMNQLVVDLQTDERDATIEGDDGTRRLYVRAQMLQAVRQAVRPHGGLAEGGTLAVKYIADGVAKKRGFNPPKQYRAEYAPPVRKLAADDIPGGGDDDERLI